LEKIEIFGQNAFGSRDFPSQIVSIMGVGYMAVKETMFRVFFYASVFGGLFFTTKVF